MNEQVRFVPPSVDFDSRLADDLANLEILAPSASAAAHLTAGRRNPFNGYVRMLSPEGGILFLYQDQNRSVLVAVLRILACIVVTGIGFLLIALSGLHWFLGFALLMLSNWGITAFKVRASHSVEIRPEAMIIDGEDVFYADDIGDNWPQLQIKDGDPELWVICGICGTRFVEYMTVNRLDENDRTAEVLAADLRAAMEQLWGRREAMFAAAY